MEWPVLGRSRMAACKRSLPEDEPGHGKKPRKTQCHWNMKLATLFKKKSLPETIEKAIEEYMMPKQFCRFLAKYGQQTARYCGRGFVSGWHPRVASTTWERFIWSVFHVGTAENGHNLGDPMDLQIAKPLEGRMVLIVYRNRHGNITQMYPKRVVNASHNRMLIDDGPEAGIPGEFHVYYQGIQSIDLYVDMPRAR